MSRPGDDVIKSFLERIVATLNEWDDSCYALVILSEDDQWHFAVQSSPEQKAIVAHGLLELAVHINPPPEEEMEDGKEEGEEEEEEDKEEGGEEEEEEGVEEGGGTGGEI